MLLVYLLLLVIVFLGLLVGLLIGSLAEEELESGRKYFIWFRNLLYLSILVVFFVYNPDYVFFIAIALLIIIFSLSRYKETLYYYALAVIFFISWIFNGFALLAPMIFLYGFPLGSLYLQDNIKAKPKKKRLVLGIILGIIKEYAGFLILGVLLGFFLFLI